MLVARWYKILLQCCLHLLVIQHETQLPAAREVMREAHHDLAQSIHDTVPVPAFVVRLSIFTVFLEDIPFHHKTCLCHSGDGGERTRTTTALTQ